MEPINTEHGKIAYEFASALIKGDFTLAGNLLSEEQKKEWNPSLLEKEYSEMLEYAVSSANHIEVMNEMVEWPEKKKNDIGWAYVAICGEDFSEAVSVVVCNERNQSKIREIEWGRP